MRWCANLPANRFLKNLNPISASISTRCTCWGWLETLRLSFGQDFNYLLGFECTKKLTSKTELSSIPCKSCRVLGRRPGAWQLAVTPAQAGFQQQCCDNRLNTEGMGTSQWRCSLSVERPYVIVMLLTFPFLKYHVGTFDCSSTQLLPGDIQGLGEKRRPSTMSWVYLSLSPQRDMSTTNSNGHIWESSWCEARIIPTGLQFAFSLE